MRKDTVYTRTMRRAAEAMGNIERLSRALGASAVEIEAWIAGRTNPPPSAFLKAIDIVAEGAPNWGPRAPDKS
jgi:hypothetical protein